MTAAVLLCNFSASNDNKSLVRYLTNKIITITEPNWIEEEVLFSHSVRLHTVREKLISLC